MYFNRSENCIKQSKDKLSHRYTQDYGNIRRDGYNLRSEFRVSLIRDSLFIMYALLIVGIAVIDRQKISEKKRKRIPDTFSIMNLLLAELRAVRVSSITLLVLAIYAELFKLDGKRFFEKGLPKCS